MGRFLRIIVKKLAQCWCLDGHVKEPYEMSMVWEPDRRSNFFSPSHLSAVTYITEISLHVMLSNHSAQSCFILTNTTSSTAYGKEHF